MKTLTLVVNQVKKDVQTIEVVGNMPILEAVEALILYDREMFCKAAIVAMKKKEKEDGSK